MHPKGPTAHPSTRLCCPDVTVMVVPVRRAKVWLNEETAKCRT